MINYIYVVSFSYVHTLLHLIKASKEVTNFKIVLEMMTSFKQSLFEFLLSVTRYFHICLYIFVKVFKKSRSIKYFEK